MHLEERLELRQSHNYIFKLGLRLPFLAIHFTKSSPRSSGFGTGRKCEVKDQRPLRFENSISVCLIIALRTNLASSENPNPASCSSCPSNQLPSQMHSSIWAALQCLQYELSNGLHVSFNCHSILAICMLHEPTEQPLKLIGSYCKGARLGLMTTFCLPVLRPMTRLRSCTP
jgi:hypothetical protein